MIRMETNIRAQYVWWAGWKAATSSPMKNANMDTMIVKETGVWVSMKPVTPAASRPQIIAGTNSAEIRSGVCPRTSSKKRQQKWIQMPKDPHPMPTSAMVYTTGFVKTDTGINGDTARASTQTNAIIHKSPMIRRK
jgi:hypothetical protein